ncbi:MAG TPA: O-antigen ligase family protein [Acidobacteriota bacterium]|nr:O-antigen ligase family protein [Acidobacteriota bacterium]
MERISRQAVTYRHIGWGLLLLFAVAAGLASVFVDPLFIMVAVAGLVNLALILKYPMWGLLIYLALFLLRPGEVYPSIAPLRLELLVGVFAVISVVVRQKLREGKVTFPSDKITLSMVAILAVMALSLFTSYEMTQTKDHCVRFLKLLVFAYLIISIVDSRKRFMTFVSAFVILITYIALDAFRLYLSGEFIHTMNVDRLSGRTSISEDPNAFGATLVSSIPICVAAALYYRHALAKVGMAVLSLFMTYLMMITASRSGLLAFFGVLFGGLAFSRQKLLNYSAAVLLLVAAWFALPEQYQARYARFTELGEDINDVSSGRWEIWQAGLRMVPEHPILGVGAGAFAWANASGRFGRAQWMQSHNLYIEVLATTGILGFAAWFYFVFAVVKRLRRLTREELPESMQWIPLFSKAFLIVIFALLISGMFGHNLYRYTWYMVAALTVALAALASGATARQVEA